MWNSGEEFRPACQYKHDNKDCPHALSDGLHWELQRGLSHETLGCWRCRTVRLLQTVMHQGEPVPNRGEMCYVRDGVVEGRCVLWILGMMLLGLKT